MAKIEHNNEVIDISVDRFIYRCSEREIEEIGKIIDFFRKVEKRKMFLSSNLPVQHNLSEVQMNELAQKFNCSISEVVMSFFQFCSLSNLSANSFYEKLISHKSKSFSDACFDIVHVVLIEKLNS